MIINAFMPCSFFVETIVTSSLATGRSKNIFFNDRTEREN
jgi:hypothetical protein